MTFFILFAMAKLLNSKRKLTPFDFITIILLALLTSGAMITARVRGRSSSPDVHHTVESPRRS